METPKGLNTIVLNSKIQEIEKGRYNLRLDKQTIYTQGGGWGHMKWGEGTLYIPMGRIPKRLIKRNMNEL
jgi:hypothetical protein